VPLLLLATPQRATLHGLGHHAGAGPRRAGDSLTRLSTSWTTPVVFAEQVSTRTAPTATTTPVPGGPQTREWNISFRQALPSTTQPALAAPVATTGPAPKTVLIPATSPVVAPTEAVAAQPVKAVVAAPKPVTPPPPASSSTAVGGASWYGARAGTCASPTLAFGTVVTVTDLSTGASVRCTVDDREARNPGRVIDLSPATFSQLASLLVGVIGVRLSW